MKQTKLSCLAILSLIATVAPAGAASLFTSSLDTSTGWTTAQEAVPSSAATFGFDYSTFGIPASPNGGGTTTGLRLTANANGTVQAITAATTTSFTGQYRITFDMWGNSVGAFPGGGTGSTEYMGGGVGFSGTNPRAGASLLTTIENGSNTIDWRLDKGATTETIASGSYNPLATSREGSTGYWPTQFTGQTPPSAQTTLFASQTGTVASGALGFKWYTMQIDVDTAAGSAAFSIINPTTSVISSIGTLTQTGGAVPVVGSGSLTLLDPFTSISNATLANDLVFALYDNYSVVEIPEPTTTTLGLALCLGLLSRRQRR